MRIMKSLYESILDDEDILIKTSSLPSKPRVNKKDYFYYQQAWYDILVDMKWTENYFQSYMTLYINWYSDWVLEIPFQNIDYDLLESGDDKELINYTLPYINKENPWLKDQNIEHLENLKDEFFTKATTLEYLFGGPYDGALGEAYDDMIFTNNSKYKQYYNTIKKYLQMRYQIKFLK